MGGMIAQVIAQEEPQLVRKLILAGTGPAGREGVERITRIAYLDIARGLLTRQDPKQFLAGHGGVFQFHGDFVKRALEFL
jgi:pimeloyl-ACP methyl ester carboxylesterase